jgi:peptidoglycan/LPS O-acetylase OafA/YrhL
MKQIAPLTGLRGAAACLVLVGHEMSLAFHYDAANFDFVATTLDCLGMSLFFVLSGFVIQYNYGDLFGSMPLRRATYSFYVARFARLYPLYAATIVLALPSIPTPFPFWVDLSYLTLTQSWFNVELAIFTPDWSISTEWFFYLMFVPLTFTLGRLRRPMSALVALCVVSVSVVGFALMRWRPEITDFAQRLFWHGDKVSADGWGWLHFFMPYLRIIEFMIGMLTARVYQTKSFPINADVAVIVGAVWCIGVPFAYVAGFGIAQVLFNNLAFAPGIAFLIIGLCHSEGPLTRLLSSSGAVFVGEISYSIYVWSFAVMTAFFTTLAAPLPIRLAYVNSGIKVLLVLLATIVVAYGSYLLIEVPSRRWLRKVLS